MSTPRPRATIVQRQAQHTVVSIARAQPAASARTSTVRMPSRNGPAPSRQTSTANVAAEPARRPHHHTPRLMPAPAPLAGAAAGPARTRCAAAGPCLEHRREEPRERDRQRHRQHDRDEEGRDAVTEPAGDDLLVDDDHDRAVGQVQAVGRLAEAANRPRVEEPQRAEPGSRSPEPARRHATAGPSARSTQNRWSSVHTEPRHQIVASTGAAAASASQAHGHPLRALLAPTIPALRMPTANSAARSGGDWITKVSTPRDVRAHDPHRRHDERDGCDHGDGAEAADQQQQQREHDVQLGLDRHRPERPVGARRADEVLHQQAVDGDRLPGGQSLPRLRNDEPGHSQAEGERRPVRREDAPGPPLREPRTLSSRQPWRAGDRASEKPDSTMNTTTAKRP